MSPYNASYYLGEGRFSQRDEVVKRAADYIYNTSYRSKSDSGLSHKRAVMAGVRSFMGRNFETKNNIGGRLGRERTISQVIESAGKYGEPGTPRGFAHNCLDYALLAATLIRAFDIPVKYTENVDFERLITKNRFRFHALNEVSMDDGSWFVFDPFWGFSDKKPEEKNAYVEKFRKIAEGLDFSDMELLLPGSSGAMISIVTRDQLKDLVRIRTEANGELLLKDKLQ
ncbi:MAG: transglutaminase-like domain-containing protein [Candidatus Aenigmatarchaeota archaeon]